MLLKAADCGLGLTAALAACLKDDRQKVRHELDELLTQRIIACGYEDASDAARLASDPVTEFSPCRMGVIEVWQKPHFLGCRNR